MVRDGPSLFGYIRAKAIKATLFGYRSELSPLATQGQQIVGQSLLSCLQYPVPYQVVYKGFTAPNGVCLPLVMMFAFRLSLFACTSGASATSHFSLDSDLEAFSHNPTDGSFGALPVQATP